MATHTKQVIRETFIMLLNKRPLSQITVRDIVEHCGINRNTFYYYYHDIPQLLESIVDEEADRMINAHPAVESLEDCLLAAVAFALENRKAVLHIYHSVNRGLYEQYQWQICEHIVTTYVDSILSSRSVSDDDRKLLINYLKCMCFGFIMGWLETGMQEEVQSWFHQLCALKRGDLEEMIARCEKKHDLQKKTSLCSG